MSGPDTSSPRHSRPTRRCASHEVEYSLAQHLCEGFDEPVMSAPLVDILHSGDIDPN
jgi:hypothetical protein